MIASAGIRAFALAAPLAALIAFPDTGTAATDVGVASAVNPDATGRLGATVRQLSIGKNIFYNERISTSGGGLVQVLFVDGSTFTVGPNSDLTIDKFVYNPQKQTGELAATLTKGMLRFVGGKLSKQPGAVNVDTPIGSIGIRGGMFQTAIGGNKNIISFLFGDELTFTGQNGQTQTIWEPNHSLVFSFGAGGGFPVIQRTTSADASMFTKAFSGKGGGGAKGPSDGQVQNSGIGSQNSGTQSNLDNIFNNLNTNNNNNEKSTGDIIRQTINDETVPLPERADARVLMPAEFYVAFQDHHDRPIGVKWPVWLFEPGENGILGGNKLEEVDDFPVIANLVNGRYEGVAPAVEEFFGGLDGLSSPTAFSFPAFNTPGIHAVIDGRSETMPTEVGELPEETLWVGSFFLNSEGSFFAYQLFAAQPNETDPTALDVFLDEPLLFFAGTPYQAPESSGAIREFTLFTDPRQELIGGTKIPFVSHGASPQDQLGAKISPLILLEQDKGPMGWPFFEVEGGGFDSTDSRSVWLQVSTQISGEGAEQESIVVVAAGLVVDTEFDGYHNPRLRGERRGSSRVFVTLGPEGEQYTVQSGMGFSGGVSTLTGPDQTDPADDTTIVQKGKDLMGIEKPSFIIGADSTGKDRNVFFGNPINEEVDDAFYNSELTGATYHIGTQELDPMPGTEAAALQTGGEFKGYAAALMESQDAYSSPWIVMTQSPEDFEIKFDATENTLWSKMLLASQENGNTTGYELQFGTKWFKGTSAYITDDLFAAFETPWKSDVECVYECDGYSVDAENYLISGGFFNPVQVFGSSEVNTQTIDGEQVVSAFCNTCAFLKWGAFGTTIKYDTGEDKRTDFAHMGWWVAGDLTNLDDLNSLANQGATATYNGRAVANVANNGAQYIANGGMNMSWSFAAREGTLNITNFDASSFANQGLNFSGTIAAPGQPGNFSGSIAGTNTPATGMVGGAAGSIVNGAGGLPGGGAMGNWNVGGANYIASGVFGGAGTPSVLP